MGELKADLFYRRTAYLTSSVVVAIYVTVLSNCLKTYDITVITVSLRTFLGCL